MKNLIKLNFLLLFGLTVLTSLYSCQKAANSNVQNNLAAIAASSAIEVSAASTTTVTTVTSSGVITAPVITSGIFVVNCYPVGGKRDSIAFISLPDTVAKYLTANYAGYTFQKTFKTLTPTGTVDGYVVIITYNGKPVGLKFDASGNFVAVLEQREGDDLMGKGWHPGGCFADRGGAPQDTLAISALPATIKTYFIGYYPTDTLLHAVVNFDATYVVISADNGLFATVFTSGGSFIKRIEIYQHVERYASVAQSGLPVTVTAYLTTTFPGYVFDKAFTETLNKVLKGYFVFINVNNTREVAEFDASGTFVKTTVIR